MSSNNSALAIEVNKLSKRYRVFAYPRQRLKQMLFGSKTRRYYNEFNALSDVSFRVKKGTSLGVIGRNGAGKSTLLQLLTGTLSPTSGTLVMHGNVAAVLELGAGFNPEFSGRENIALYCSLYRMPKETQAERFDTIVAFSELAAFIDQPIKTYSSGMMARLAFSVIAHLDADILIIDEALSVGDASFNQKCMRFLKEFQKKGTILFVSHDIAAIRAFCDQAIWLDGGQVMASGPTAKVCEAYLASVYPGQPLNSGSMVSTNIADAVEEMPEAGTDQEEATIHRFRFHPQSGGFGSKDAHIISVAMLDTEGQPLRHHTGGTVAELVIRARAEKMLQSPIIGFFVKDTYGQPLIGTNTYRSYREKPVPVRAGEIIEARFTFRMPVFNAGSYAISAAIAEGTPEDHTQLHWMHDAALFTVIESSADGVQVGIPMQKIKLGVVAA